MKDKLIFDQYLNGFLNEFRQGVIRIILFQIPLLLSITEENAASYSTIIRNINDKVALIDKAFLNILNVSRQKQEQIFYILWDKGLELDL